MKVKVIALCLGTMLVLSGCGGSDTKVIEGEVQAVTTGNETSDDASAGGGEQSQEQAKEEAGYKGYAYICNDVVIEVDAEATPIIDALGEADSYFESPSCAFEGIDKTYTYGSIEVDTYPMEEKDYISAIVFKDDSVTTLEGVGIGDSVDKVKEVYGADGKGEGGMLVYMKDGMKLCFIIQDDAVAAIEYCSTVLDE